MLICIYSNLRDRLLRKYLQATATMHMLLPFHKSGIYYFLLLLKKKPSSRGVVFNKPLKK